MRLSHAHAHLLIPRSLSLSKNTQIPDSVRLWTAAAALETDKPAQLRVLKKALERVPYSVSLWKSAIELVDEDDAKVGHGACREVARSGLRSRKLPGCVVFGCLQALILPVSTHSPHPYLCPPSFPFSTGHAGPRRGVLPQPGGSVAGPCQAGDV